MEVEGRRSKVVREAIRLEAVRRVRLSREPNGPASRQDFRSNGPASRQDFRSNGVNPLGAGEGERQNEK